MRCKQKTQWQYFHFLLSLSLLGAFKNLVKLSKENPEDHSYPNMAGTISLPIPPFKSGPYRLKLETWYLRIIMEALKHSLLLAGVRLQAYTFQWE